MHLLEAQGSRGWDTPNENSVLHLEVVVAIWPQPRTQHDFSQLASRHPGQDVWVKKNFRGKSGGALRT